MPNTTVTIKYSDGTTREFIASDELEKSIIEGEMFSVTTMHPDYNELCSLSKMYVGNPMSALGHMIMMRRNAEKVLESEGDGHICIVIETLTACIKLLSDEITSHDSGMTVVDSEGDESFAPGENEGG